MVDGPEVMATTVARVESSVVTVARERAEMPWLKGWRQSTRPALSVEIRGKVTTYVLCIHDDGGRARALVHTNSRRTVSGHQGDDIQQTAFSLTPCAGQTCPEAVLPAAVEAEAEARAEAAAD